MKHAKPNWPILLKDAKEKGWYWDADEIN